MTRMHHLPALMGSPFKGLTCDAELDVKRRELQSFSDQMQRRKLADGGKTTASGALTTAHCGHRIQGPHSRAVRSVRLS